LTLFVPVYTRVAARFGARAVTVWTLLFFGSNVLLFWYAFRHNAASAPPKQAKRFMTPPP